MSTPLEYQRVRDPAHLRSAYLESATPADARAFFRAHITQWEQVQATWEAELARVTEITSPMLQRRLAATPVHEHAAAIAYKRHTYEGLIERARGEIIWALSGLGLVDLLSVDTSTGMSTETMAGTASMVGADEVSARTP